MTTEAWLAVSVTLSCVSLLELIVEPGGALVGRTIGSAGLRDVDGL